MTDLTPLTALGATTARALDQGGLSLREVPDLALASLVPAPDAPSAGPFGLSLPGPGFYVDAGDRAVFWTAPGQWMVAAEGSAETDFAAALLADLPGALVTEQTDGFAAVDISGAPERIAALLERLVNLPQDALMPGRAARTGLHHMTVFVLRPAPEALRILGMRSLAGSLWHVLDETTHRLEDRT